jgi:polyferredoxin
MNKQVAQTARTIGKSPRQRSYAQWRAATLVLVHVLIAAHITHWVVAGKTLAPLELNEVIYTLELGIITAGFLFMAAVTLATSVFGRFFCSWGCHILALQDLCHWLLGKFHIRPRPIRSRALLWAPIVTVLYMFVWPQIVRVSEGRPFPRFHLRTDAEGWASLSTENFWRNLPGPGIAVLTFGVCGFLIVYVLGSRGFCTYGCPYGAVFGLADRFAPGRIRLVGGDCSQCGACTAACGSNIRVHGELNRFGMVVSSACLKDLDCVAACPSGNVRFAFGRPALLKTIWQDTPVRKRYDFSIWEEVAMVVVFLAVLVTYRGLYDRVPFLLAIGLGAIVAFLAVLSVRMVRRSDLQWNRLTLKHNGRLSRSGFAFLSVMAIVSLFSIHSAIVHCYSFQGRRLATGALAGRTDKHQILRAIDHLDRSQRFGLLTNERDASLLADLNYQAAGIHFREKQPGSAERYLKAAISARPQFAMAHYDLGALLIEKGDLTSGIGHLRIAVDVRPDFAEGHYNLGLAYWMSGAEDMARRAIESAFAINSTDEQIRRLHQAITATSPAMQRQETRK